jgi:hypothetical protein
VSPSILGFATNIYIEKLFADTNNERVSHGLKSLTLNSALSRAAQKKAEDMFADDYWAHVAPDGTTPWDFINREGYKYIYAGENLARDFNDSDAVVTAWMNSPSHRENLLRNDYEEIGFAVVNGKLNGSDTTLVVQMFGTKRPTYIAETGNAESVQPTPTISIPRPTANVQITIVPTATPTVVTRISLTPTPTDIIVASLGNNPVQGAVQKPFFNQKVLERTLALGITAILLFVLVLDGYFIWRHKVIRIAGHNFAHFIFLFVVLCIVVIGTSGVIL